MVEMTARCQADIAMALCHIEKAQEKQRKAYAKQKSSKRWHHTFKVWDSMLLLDARRGTRKGGPLTATYRGPYNIVALVGKRVKLQSTSGTLLERMQNISHLKPFKKPLRSDSESIPEKVMKPEIPLSAIEQEAPTQHTDEVENNVSNMSAAQAASTILVRVLGQPEVVETEMSKCCKSDSEAIEWMEAGEEKEWIWKVKIAVVPTETDRLEATVGSFCLYGSSFRYLPPRQWLIDEVIDAYLFCAIDKAAGKCE
ncbi:uncharacterized protein LOC142017177 [Carettochelys insculpta]|uniref:uncharacterized protein LOC142017177 n=1 Tax=Carettochelys insculpta TaxID=44489 RepID=UPI003EB91C5D